MFSRPFVRDLAERTIATFAEALAVLLLASGTGLLDASWQTSLSLAGMTGLVALLKGVASGYKDPETGASVLSEPPPRVRRNDHGEVDVLSIIAIVFVVLAILVVLGFVPVR